MKHTVRLSEARVMVTCSIISFLSGVVAGKNTRAVVHGFLQMHYIPVIALLLAVLLSGLVMTCTAVSWMWQKCL